MSQSQISNFKSQTTIRPAFESDMGAVLALIRDLAMYEKAPDEVTITLEELIHDGFTAKLFTCIVAEMDGAIVGMSLFYPRFSTWQGGTIHLEDFIVKEAYRKHGIGKMLFDATVKAANDFGAKRLEWLVLEWNEPALNFYRKIGATMDAEWHIGKLTEEQLKEY